MVNYEELIAKLEEQYNAQKDNECAELYSEIVEVLRVRKATIQNVLFVLKMIEWGYLRAKYLQLVEKTVKIPEGSVPLPTAQEE